MGIKSTLGAARRALRKRIHFHHVRRSLGPAITGDPLYAGNDAARCFADRPCATPATVDLERIVAAYQAAKKVQQTLPAAYQVGNEWLPTYRHHMGAVMGALAAGDVPTLNRIYENFMRDSCSTGLHGMPIDMQTAYFSGRISDIDADVYLYDAVYRHMHWRELSQGRFPTDSLRMPDFGNPYGLFVDGQFVRVGADYFHHYASTIGNLLEGKVGRKYVAELGGGYGGLGYFLMRDQANLGYIDFDLPENMALTAYFLLCAFPEKRVLLYGEAPFDAHAMEAYDIIVLPNFELASLPDRSIDLVFNSYSLAEMSVETIRAYIPQLARACRDAILHVNHTRNPTSLAADDFGIPSNEFKLMYRRPALWNLGRNVDMDEFEFLYQRI